MSQTCHITKFNLPSTKYACQDVDSFPNVSSKQQIHPISYSELSDFINLIITNDWLFLIAFAALYLGYFFTSFLYVFTVCLTNSTIAPILHEIEYNASIIDLHRSSASSWSGSTWLSWTSSTLHISTFKHDSYSSLFVNLTS